MKAFRLASILLLFIILLTGVPYLGYVLYQKYSRPASLPLDAVPDKAAFVIRINNPANLYAELNRSNLIWNEISAWPGVSEVRDELKLLDSLTGTDRNIRKLLKDNPVYITLSLTGRAGFGLMYLAGTGNDMTPALISEFLKQRYPEKVSVVSAPYASTEILRFHPEGMKEPMFITVSNGVFIMSHHSNLVKKAIDRLSLNYIPGSVAGFRTIEATAGKRADANIFVNIPYLSLSAWKISSEDKKRDLVRLARFADWCGLDLVIRKDELLFSGYTLYSDSTYYTLSLYAPQSPQAVDAVNILPDNVTTFTLFSLENLGWFLSDLREREHRLENAAEPGRLSQFNASRNMRLERYFLPWTRHQLCFASAGLNDGNERPYPLLAIQHSDPDSSLRSLLSLAEALGKKTDSVRYNERTIYLSDLSEPLNALLGSFRQGIRANCFMLFEGYTIFAESPVHLVHLMNHYRSGTTLAKERSYLDISENVSGQSNIYFYTRPGQAIAEPPSMFGEVMTGYFRPLADSLRKFEAMTLQIVNRKGMFYTTISLRFNPNLSNEGPLAWQSMLDTTVAGTPQIVARSFRGDQALLTTDTMNTLYMIDSAGVILWKKKLYGKVLGSYHPIRVRGSDSLHYLFNTENHLYLVRSDGEIAERFPMKFPLRATNGLALADYNNTGDYRILIAFRDNRVYNFSLDGIMVEGWSLPGLSEEITEPVQYLVHDHKDHLVIRGSRGDFLIADRRGKVRIRPAKPFLMAPGSMFYLNHTGKKGALLTSDQRGRIILLAENGKTTSLVCSTFTAGHYFRYDDITGNEIPDFIFFDRNTLSIYNRSLKPIFSYKFLRDVPAPHLLKTVNGNFYIGIFSPATREVFLFDKKGLTEIAPAIRGTTPFDIGNLENKRHLNLVIGTGKSIKCFRLTQNQ
jgi:hypothetical protein